MSASNSDGDDGAPLTDYDLIGSSLERTGVFALHSRRILQFSVHSASVARSGRGPERFVGGGALLQGAARAADRRSARQPGKPPMMPCAGLRDWNFANENALMYFPRVLAHDKLRGHFESFAPCGAVAGMLARYDEVSPVWMSRGTRGAHPAARVSAGLSGRRGSAHPKLAVLGVNTHAGGALGGAHRACGRALWLQATPPMPIGDICRRAAWRCSS